MARLLFVGDLHAGKGANLGRTPGERLAEQSEALAAALEVARDEGCDAAVTLGDMWDKRNPTADEVMAVVSPLRSHLDQGGCPILGIPGNHEVSNADGGTMPAAVSLAGITSIVSRPGVRVAGDTAICMLPWTPIGRIVAASDGADRDSLNQTAADLLINVAANLHREATAPRKLLALHWSVSGTALPSGLPVDELREVVIPMEALLDQGWDTIVAGHIHRPGVYADGRFAYVGPPLPLDHGAHQGDHGCWLWDNGALSMIGLPSRRFITLDMADLGRPADVAGAFVRVRGTVTEDEHRRLDIAGMRATLEQAGAYQVTFDLTVERAHRDRAVALTDGQTQLDQLAAYLEASGVNGSRGTAMLQRAEEYLR